MKNRMLWLQLSIVSILASTLALHSCGGGGGSAPAPPPARYSIGGTVSGLSGTGLVLRNNGADDLSIASSGTFTFATALADGAGYDVTVTNNPTALTQTCTASSNTGTVTAANVSSVLVNCSTTTYSVGGTVSGLSGTGLVLRNNGGDDLGIAASGTFTFATALADGAGYNVTVKINPTALTQTCTASSNTGTVTAANVRSVLVSCSTTTYSVGGTVSGLSGTGLVLRNNGGDDLGIASSGTFTFASWIADGAPYSVTVGTQPAAPVQACVVSSGTGTIAAAAITNVSVACTTTPLSVGAVCSGDGQCASGICECADGTCTTKRCSAANCVCKYVNVPGVCTFNFAIGTDPGSDCPGYQCNGSGACLTSCATINDCDADRYCNVANSCVLKNAVGTPCTGSEQCMNGFCKDGVCCESSCTGGACDFTGNCTGSASGSQCSASDQCNSGTCSGGVCQ